MKIFIPVAASLLCLVLGEEEKGSIEKNLNKLYEHEYKFYNIIDTDTIDTTIQTDYWADIPKKVAYTEDIAEYASGRSLVKPTDVHHYYILHDWLENGKEKWTKHMTKAILLNSNNRAVRFRIAQFSGAQRYFDTADVTTVGENIKSYLIREYRSGNITFDKVTLIGLGLGAHTAGVVGKTIFEKTGKKLGRIIASSPTGPHFHVLEDDKKLHKDDAECVIAIHTDQLLLGYKSPIGGIDFFVNGGASQPGCKLGEMPCSHHRGVDLLVEAFEYSRDSATLAKFEDSPDGRKRFIQTIGGDCSARNSAFNVTTNPHAPYL